MNRYDELDSLVERYITEKKTREEYAVDKFKKRYKFEPDHDGVDTGTITVNGEKYDIDMKTKNPISARNDYVQSSPASRNTRSDLIDGHITIGKEYFSRIKNQQRRDALLNHEVAHTKFHTFIPKTNIKKDERKLTRRAETTSLNTNKHFNAEEIEADAYASRVSGKKNLKKALQDAGRKRALQKSIAQQKTGNEILDDLNSGKLTVQKLKRKHKIEKGKESSLKRKDNEEMKKIHAAVKNDYYKRSKALDSKELQNIKTIKDEADRVKKNKR